MKKDILKRAEPKFPKPMPRHMVIPALLHKYVSDCEEIVLDFPKDKRLELLEHLIGCLDLIAEYTKAPEDAIWKKYTEKEELFLKKHKSRLKLYRDKALYTYYLPDLILPEQDIYTSEEYNKLPYEDQELNAERMGSFISRCKSCLCNERDFILLGEDPEDEKEKESEKENSELNGKDPKVSQSAQLLIIYYLLKELGVEARSTTDISEVARFAHFLLGKKIGILSNSDIYKRLRKMPNIKSDKELVKDLQTIRPLFAALDLKDIVFQIDKEIGLARKERLKKSRHPED